MAKALKMAILSEAAGGMGGHALWLPPQHLRTCVFMHSGVRSQPWMAALGAGHGVRSFGYCNMLFLDSSSRTITLCTRLHTKQRLLSRTIRGKGYGKSLISCEDYCGFLHEILAVGVLGFRKSGRILITKASSDGSEKTPGSPSISAKLRNRLKRALDVPRTVWAKLVHPLSNFGFGRRSVWEAGVGLFVLWGFILFFMALAWVKGVRLRTSRKYLATFEFSKAWGITIGTAVRIRGVDVGSVAAVRPSLERLDVVVQIADARVVIPRNALVEVNQSGLVSETLIDITPRFPLPQPTVGPLDPNCQAEGLIVCHRDRIKGEQGVSLDELVKICTKLAQQIDEQGLQKLFEASERISLAVEEAKPLLAKAESMAGDIAPLIKEIQDGGFLQDLDHLIKAATAAVEDLRKLNTAILTPENTELLRQSVSTLTKTLKHVENISGDLGILTSDAGMQYNLKQLIQSLSRLVD